MSISTAAEYPPAVNTINWSPSVISTAAIYTSMANRSDCPLAIPMMSINLSSTNTRELPLSITGSAIHPIAAKPISVSQPAISTSATISSLGYIPELPSAVSITTSIQTTATGTNTSAVSKTTSHPTPVNTTVSTSLVPSVIFPPAVTENPVFPPVDQTEAFNPPTVNKGEVSTLAVSTSLQYHSARNEVTFSPAESVRTMHQLPTIVFPEFPPIVTATVGCQAATLITTDVAPVSPLSESIESVVVPASVIIPPSLPDPTEPQLTVNPNIPVSNNIQNFTPTEAPNPKHNCIFHDLRRARETTAQNFRMCHLNINSLASKFDEVKEILNDNLTDFMTISETKIDDTYRDALFEVDGFKLQRCDRNKDGGGIATWIRSDLVARRRTDIEDDLLENITYDVTMEGSKWLIFSIYRPPAMKSTLFIERFFKLIDKGTTISENIIVLGDLNFDMNCPAKSRELEDICDVLSLKNLVTDSTCFKSLSNPSTVDVFLTNQPQLLSKIINFNTGVSDFHNMISTCIKKTIPATKLDKKEYRDFRNFDLHSYQNDLELKLKESENSSGETLNVNVAYAQFSNAILSVADKHAPIKEKSTKNVKNIPHMNKALKKAIYVKRMAQNRFRKERSESSWKNWKKCRNTVTKLKKQSMRKYFFDKCTGGQKNKNFWPTIKPFLSTKNKSGEEKITLMNDDKVINNTQEVCSTFNSFFTNVAKDIGSGMTFVQNSHPSIKAINENYPDVPKFDFKPTDTETIRKIINGLDDKKATGKDGVSVKLLKASCPMILNQLCDLINQSIDTSTFPDELKCAQVRPLLKKNDPLDKKNYRPVSILPIISKVFEKVLFQQLSVHFDSLLNELLCAFRINHGCHTVLLKLIEDWKKALDQRQFVAAIMMDLSKAFDCLPHEIIISKLLAYGVTDKATKLLQSYLSDRKQQVKIGGVVSEWQEIVKGVPQGSILGPLLFNIFMNDIFLFVNNAGLYNYADDNTLSYNHSNFEILISVLEKESRTLVEWFRVNCMQANPDKFQAIALGKRTNDKNPLFNIGTMSLPCEESVRLLGVEIDSELKFNTHIKEICRKASKQLNVLRRIGKHLSKLNKLIIFHTFILSNFNFCPLAWHFCSKANTEKIEKIQERALRFIYDDCCSTYEMLLEKAQIPSLEIKRVRTLAIETYKILNGLSANCLKELVSYKERSYNFRHIFSASIPMIKTTHYGKQSFRYAAAVTWNKLPENIRTAKDLNTFKFLISKWIPDN